MGAKGEDVKERVEVAKRYRRAPSQWNREKLQIKSTKAEVCKSKVSGVTLPLGASGKWGACGWAVVQLDSDEE